ncbi:PREDICTED: uncharacterized protein LOC109210008 [Nicotiana attenuata]|uniref:Uncharacterized protein n=1 Tax=Nicotiana attenuata TaxID=49451 RepID=A0A314KMK9_NICAT|nr:PREDICTED: uncharacterized protein LOC109210008 [Nicotiana attenuata]XP_019228925.1 PREDICTED: uncharacterized protein LOC109210008 [Nicotiana attenuata]XP_019228926.1 PREDICTED: uncharacterized protein LOC109210008 [Nicotiana attenuata]OIT30425.1 hypothetical protein A4A49_25883 [Nicotiana attenuata]
MPVSGNEEPGVLSRQPSNSSSGIPIKKRWYSMVQSPSPTRAEPSSLSNESESKTKGSCLVQGSTLSSCDSTSKSDTVKNTLLEVKKEKPSDPNVDSPPTLQPFLTISRETNPDTSSGPSGNVDNQVKPASAKKLASQEVPGRTIVNVKKEIVAKQGKSQCKLELPADSGHIELSLGPKKPRVSSLVDPNTEGSCLLRGTVNPSLLSLSLNKGKDISQDGSCKNGLNNNDSDDTAHTNRSNWDLNTPMDSWEGSGDDVPVQDASHIDMLSKTSSSLDREPSISSASVVGANVDKGKQVVGASEREFNFPISLIQPSLPYKSADVLPLSLGSTLRGFDSSILQSLAKVDSSRVSPNSSLLKNLAMNSNMNSPTRKTVKSEPVEEALVQDNAGTACRPAGTLDANVVKPEVVRQNLEPTEMSTKGPQKLLEQKPVKCEPLQEVSQEISMTSDVIAHQSVGRVLQLQESSSSSSSTLPMPLTPQKGCPSRLSTCSDLSVMSGDLSTQSEYSVHTEEANRSKNALDQANADIAAKNANFDLKESNVSSDKVEASVLEGINVEDKRETHHLVASGVGSAIDEEKISISAGTEEECYGSDYESDGNHAFAGHVDAESVGCGREDEEYEEGEVREPMMQSIAEDPIAEGMDSEKNSKSAHSAGSSGVEVNYDEKDNSLPVHTESNDDFVKGCDEKADKIDHKDGNLRSPLLDKEETTGADEQRPIGAIQQGPVDQSRIAVLQEGCQKDVLCDEAPTGSSGSGRNVGEANNENIGGFDMAPTVDSSLQNAETSINANSNKDLSNVGSKSRIINLPRASNVTSPSNVRTITGRSLPSRSGRERYSDIEEEKFHLRKNRDETYADGPKFVRHRNEDRSFGSSRGNFMRGRGRGSGRFDSSRSDWDSGRDFESYGGGTDYRFRRKRTAAVGESEIERNDYDRLDGADFVSNRRRKPLNDSFSSFRHPPARRLSPNGREDAAMMGIQMLRRAPRNISPSRCTGEDGSDGPDGHFIRGNTKFTTMQRRGFPRMRSKSPARSRTRPPGPWSSPRRRPTEGFNGLPDSSQHRSPAMYREDRMRSSPRTSFTDDMVPRRRDSPSYTARRLNDMRDVDAGQEHGHPRSLSIRRSPPDRVFTRNRRLEMLDRRERADGDDYFDGPIHTGRFPELRSGGSTDERRKYGERRGGPARSFRPSYNSENDTFRFNQDGGPRPFRFYPEADEEFVERNNTREREFDANIKDRPLPRRMRNVEEQEGNFRQSGQVWHEEGFDVSRLKRRRF